MEKFYVTIPTPCHESWDQMSQVEKGRFCGSCHKTVIDFTSMSDRELVAFFKKPATSVCGRMHPDQLNREISAPKKRQPWLKYFFTVTWPAFMLFLKSCNTKDKLTGEVVAVHANKPNIDNNSYTETAIVGFSIPVVSLSLGIDTVVVTEDIACPNESKISTAKLETIIGDVAVSIDSVNKEEDTAFIESRMKELDTVIVTDGGRKDLGGYVGGLSVVRVSNTSSVPIIAPASNDKHAGALFAVYPNPVRAGNTLTIRFDQEEEEPVQVHVLSAAGQTIAIKQVMGFASGSSTHVSIPYNTATGIYYTQVVYKSGRVEKTSILISR